MTADSRLRISDSALMLSELIKIMKLLIDFGRIGNGSCDFHSERLAITLTQTRDPGAQCRNGNSKFGCRCFLTQRRRPCHRQRNGRNTSRDSAFPSDSNSVCKWIPGGLDGDAQIRS